MSSEDAENNPVEQPDSPPQGRLGAIAAKLRAPLEYARAHKRIAIAAGAIVLLTSGAVAGWLALRPSPLQVANRLAGAALEALDEDDLEAARQRAQDVCRRTDLEGPLAIANFVLGATGVKEAEKAAPAAKAPLFLAAARFFEDALTKGLPDDHRSEAQWLRGRCLYEAGQMEASRAALDEALEAHPERASQIRRLLAEAFLRDCPPKLDEALQQNKSYLAIDDLTATQRQEGLLQQAEILVTMGKPAETLRALAEIGPDAKSFPAASVVEGRALLQEGRALKAKATSAESRRQAEEKLQAALAVLRKTRQIDPARTQAGRQSLYWIGVCLLESGDERGAVKHFHELRTLDATEPECLAGSFREGEILRRLGRVPEAASAYCRALDAAGVVKPLRNPWVSLEEVRKGVLGAYQQDMETRHYSAAVELARRAGVVVSVERALQMQAEACRAWGRDLLTQSEKLNANDAEALAREGRTHLRRASLLWRQLGRRREASRLYPEDLWESAVCALEGRDYRGAASLLEEYLKRDSRGRPAKALAALGESLLATDRIDEAIEALRKCIDRHPRDMAALRARLLISQALGEKGDLVGARRALEENLSGESITPASREYRESLFALGHLLCRAKRYEEAIRRFEEAVRRYAEQRQTLDARYLIADCYRQVALAENDKLGRDLVEQSRGARVHRIRGALESSLQWYRQAQQALLKCQESSRLTPLEQRMLRNSDYFIGSVLLDLGQFDAAVQAYARAVSRRPGAPETLEAYVQIARALRAMNKLDEARGAIEQAKQLLAGMKPDAPLEQTTHCNKAQWTALLDKLGAM